MALVTLPRPLVVDINGDPRIAARMYLYNAGTNTPRIAYTSKSYTIEHAQPILTVEGGIFPVVEVDPAGGDYKIVLQDRDGAEIYSADNLSPVVDQLTSQNVGLALNLQTQAESFVAAAPVDYSIPSHATLGYVNPARFGFSTSATGAVNYAALVKAVAVANQARCSLGVSAGTYAYAATATVVLQQNFIGVGGLVILTCDTSIFTGVFFQQIGSTRNSNILGQTAATSASYTKLGTFLRQMPTVTTDFTGYQKNDNVGAFGFAIGFDVGNTFENEWRDCNAFKCGIGFNCVPPSNGGDSGYVTTHHHVNCNYGRSDLKNDQPVVYNSTLQSRGVIFTNCAIEHPGITGSTFTRVRGLEFIGCYFEGSPLIKALILNDCSASMNAGQGYFNGTAGILLGTNTEVMLTGIRPGSATDVITGGDGTQIVTLINCQFPSSGNVINFARFVAINSQINGAWYQFYGPQPVSGTLTLTGCTTSPTGAITAAINSGEVTAEIVPILGTSNTTAATLTGLPAAITPSANRNVIGVSQDNSANVPSIWTVRSDGQIVMFNGGSATFTGSGSKGVGIATTIHYRL